MTAQAPPSFTAALKAGRYISYSVRSSTTELVAVRLENRAEGLYAVPVRGKSGLISQLSMADGYLCVARNQEGIPAGALVEVNLF